MLAVFASRGGRQTWRFTKTSGQGLLDAELTTSVYDEARSGYHNVGQLTTLANANAVYTSDYDSAGRKAREIRNVDAQSYTAATSYDVGGRVTAKTMFDGSSIGPFGYNAAGQQVTLSGALQPHAVQSAGPWTFTYDANGNQLHRYTSAVLDREIGYDNDNRPVTVTQGPATVTYIYGPDGERLKKLTATGTTLYSLQWGGTPARQIQPSGLCETM